MHQQEPGAYNLARRLEILFIYVEERKGFFLDSIWLPQFLIHST